MLRVTADSNIFISALNFKGKPLELLTLARAGNIELAMSDAIMAEVKRVLTIKFKWPGEDVDAIEKQLNSFTRHVVPDQVIDAVKDDPTDNRILECAVAAGSNYVVSGDNHLLKLGRYGGSEILNAADFLNILGNPGKLRS